MIIVLYTCNGQQLCKAAYTAIRLSKIGRREEGREEEEREEGSPILWLCDFRPVVHFLNLTLPYS